MSDIIIEYRAWTEDGTLLGSTEQEDTADGYRQGMAYARKLIADAESELDMSRADLEFFGSPFSIQICRDDIDVTDSYGIGWIGEY